MIFLIGTKVLFAKSAICIWRQMSTRQGVTSNGRVTRISASLPVPCEVFESILKAKSLVLLRDLMYPDVSLVHCCWFCVDGLRSSMTDKRPQQSLSEFVRWVFAQIGEHNGNLL